PSGDEVLVDKHALDLAVVVGDDVPELLIESAHRLRPDDRAGVPVGAVGREALVVGVEVVLVQQVVGVLDDGPVACAPCHALNANPVPDYRAPDVHRSPRMRTALRPARAVIQAISPPQMPAIPRLCQCSTAAAKGR